MRGWLAARWRFRVRKSDWVPDLIAENGEAKNPGPRHIRHRDDYRPLRETVVTEETLEARRKGFDVLMDAVVATSGVTESELASFSLVQINDALGEAVEWLYRHDYARDLAVNGLLALSRKWFWFRHGLAPTWDLLNSWRLRMPVEPRKPLPVLLVRAMIGMSLLRERWEIACGVWLGFHGLLRPGEFADMTWQDLTFINHIYGHMNRAVATIQNPKTRSRGPRRQHVIISDPCLIALLQHEASSVRDVNRTIIRVSQEHFARLFKLMIGRLGIPDHWYTPASLRAGGATHEYLSNRPIAEIKFRGRWGAEKSLEHYIQECSTFMDLHQLGGSVLSNLNIVADCVPYLVQARLSR